MASKIKTALIMSSAILSAASLPAFAQTLNSGNGPRSDGNAKMRWVDEVAPRTITTETRQNMTSESVEEVLTDPGFTTLPSLAATGGDNLGSHVATQDLDMAQNLIINVAAPVDIFDAANKSYVDAAAEGAKDNLGDHTATQVLKMMNFEIVGLPSPLTPTSATNRAYVDTKVLEAKDNLGNHTAQMALKMSNFRIVEMATPVNAADGANKAYVDQMAAAAKDNLGNHTATLNLDMATKSIINLATPVDATDAANKGYVDGVLDGAVDTITVEIDALKARKINTTAGILGGGDLSQDRTLSFDTVWGDARYALAARVMSAGTGLTGGGSLAGDRSFALSGQALALHNLAVNGFFVRTGLGTVGARSILGTTGGGITVTNGNGVAGHPTLAVDDSVVATLAGAQTFSGAKNFTLSPTVPAPLALADAVNKGYVDTAIAGVKTDIGNLSSRRIDTVDGIKGGGDLSANRTLSFDTVWGDARYALSARTLTAGDGLSGGGDLSANRSLAVDGTVVRTSGAQTIAGLKTFQNLTGTEFRQAAGQDGVALLGRAGGTGAFEVKVTPGTLTADRTLTLADGDTTLVAGTMVPTTRSLATGSGLTGGGDLSANRTLGIDSAVVATLAGTQVVTGGKTFTFPPTVPAPVAGTDAANKSYVDAAISGAISAAAYTAGDGLSLTGRTFAVDGSVVRTSRAIATASGLTGGGDLTANRTLGIDATVVATLAGAQTFAGAKTFTLAPTVPAPTLATDAANKKYVDDTVSGSVAAAAYAAGDGMTLTGRTFAVDPTVVRTSGAQTLLGAKTFGAPIQISGATTSTAGAEVVLTAPILTADRTVTFADGNTTLVAGTMVPTTRSIATGTGLTGGGDLSANRTLGIDSTVVATLAGAQTFSGAKTFSLPPTVPTPVSGGDATNKTYVDGAITGAVTAAAYTAGDGLSLTGRTFAVDGSVVRTSRSITAGSGLTGGGDLSANRTLGIDSSVVATLAGAQTFAGAKTFTLAPTVPAPTLATDAANKKYVDDTVSGSVAAAAYTAGDGMTLSGRTFAVDPTVVRTSGAQTLLGTKTFGAPIQISGAATSTAGTEVILTAPILTADRTVTFADGNTTLVPGTMVPTTRSLATGSGLTGGGDLSANRTLGIDSTVVATLAGAQTFAGAKTFSLSPTVPAPTLGTHAVNKDYLDTALANFTPPQNYSAGDGLTLTSGVFAADDTVLRSTGSYANPAWLTALAGSKITGTISIANGGTGATTASAARTALDVPSTAGLGAAGTWGISISGNAATATTAGKWTTPRSFTIGATAKTVDGSAPVSWSLAEIGAQPDLGFTPVNKAGDTGIGTLQFLEGTAGGVRFGHASQTDANDGFIAAGRFGTGLNIVGTQTATGTGRQVRVWGSLIDSAGTAYITNSGTWSIGITGNAGTATKLSTSRTISISGDVTGAATFDGSANAPITATLSNSGVTAGTYGSGTTIPSITVDAKGRITAASASSIGFPVTSVAGKTGAVTLVSADITDATSANTAGKIVERDASGNFAAGTISAALNGNAATATRLAADRTINGVVFNGTGNINVADLRDSNGKTLIDGTGVASAVNYVTLTNAATGGTVQLLTAGTDVNVPLEISTKGTGALSLGNGAGNVMVRPGANQFRLYDDSNDNYINVNVKEMTDNYSLNFATDGNTTLTAGTMLATDDLLASGSTATGAVKYNGTTALVGAFYGGTTSPASTDAARLNYGGHLYANQFFASAYYYFSDQRLKKDVVALEGMGLINELRPVSYTWKGDDRKALGLIAQEVEAVYPTAVTTNEEGIKAVDYIQLIAPMLAAIQDLDARVKELEAR